MSRMNLDRWLEAPKPRRLAARRSDASLMLELEEPCDCGRPHVAVEHLNHIELERAKVGWRAVVAWRIRRMRQLMVLARHAAA